MKKLLFSVIGISFLTATPLLAADRPIYKAPPPVLAMWEWTGCYIGIAGGGAWGRTDHINDPGGSITGGSFNMSGGIVGGTLGCNYQVHQWVIGIEGDFSWTNKRGSRVDVPPFNPAFTSETLENWLATIRGRWGWKFGAQNQAMFYITGGAAVADIEIHVFAPGFDARETQTRWGWTIGGGVEWAVWPPVPSSPWLSVKVEYLYVDFGDDPYFNPPPAGFANRAGGVPVINHIVRAGLNWHF
jgi:outer membrane immunogenic protein